MADLSSCQLCPFFLPVNPVLTEEQPSWVPERCSRGCDQNRKDVHQHRDATAAIRTEQTKPMAEGVALGPAKSVVELHAMRALHVLPHGCRFITPKAQVDSLWNALPENDFIEDQRWIDNPVKVEPVLPFRRFGAVPSALGADEVIVIVQE
ncbi:MAG: hypothetical protein HS101_11195 [Planctomycetia bacterium]|nr:hypothetical protein [Planctomycetia bacterium]